MKSAVKVAVASLVGGLAVHGALTACGGSGGGSANAQSSPSCSAWQVAVVDDVIVGLILSDGTPSGPGPTTVPAGWEPFGLYGQSPLVRRCAP
jgi:hypothetical protein